MLDTRQGCC